MRLEPDTSALNLTQPMDGPDQCTSLGHLATPLATPMLEHRTRQYFDIFRHTERQTDSLLDRQTDKSQF